MFDRTNLVVVLISLVHVCAGKQCMMCAPGKFKSPDMFFTPCTLCPNNTFSATPGAAECARCPPFSSSVMGSSRCTFDTCRAANYTDGCVCPAGTTGPDGGACVACAAGTYKSATGSAACDNCSSTRTSVAGSAACFCKANFVTTDTGDCEPCMHGMISRENSASCFCPNGTAIVDGSCSQIYNNGLRLSGFVLVNETNSTNTSSSDLQALSEMIKHSIASQYNVSEDLVQVIFTTPSRNLLQETGLKVDVIIMGRSPEELASIVNKTSIDPPHILEEVEQSTVPISTSKGVPFVCGENEVSISATCVCAPGYTRCRTCGKCIACAPGLAKAVGGEQACTTCSGNTFSRKAAAQCSPCPFSAVTQHNHTSCSCNTAFVFFKDTCTPTESVYLSVSGVLQLPQDEYTDADLRRILADGFSEYLNFSREFITISVSQDNQDANDASAGNSSAARRRLLYDRPVEYNFAAQFQVEMNDRPTYLKIENFTKHATDTIKSIMDANGYVIVLNYAALLQGYFTADGKPISKCEDGRDRVLDFLKKLLFCDVRTPSGEVAKKPALWWLWLVLAAVLALIIAAVVVFRSHDHQATARRTARRRTAAASQQQAMFPAKLHFPATVSFEYHLLPGNSI